MLPIGPNNQQNSGIPVSSNLVIWQGPDIECINLCRGDSISDVTYKLALELCDLLTQVDVSTFDLSCFDPVCPTIKNFHELIQFLIDKICTLQTTGTTGSSSSSSDSGGSFRTGGGAGSGSSTTGTGNSSGSACPDCMITVPQCFWYYDNFGSLITQMQLIDYATAMANKICTILNDITNIKINQTNMQLQINYITENYRPVPQIPLPVFVSTCLTDKIPVVPPTGIALSTMIQAIESAFCELRTATGMPNDILTAIFKQCVALDTSLAMNLPGVTMAAIPGWVSSGSYSTLANSINNMWITICDLRAAVGTIMATCCPQGCDGLVLSLQMTFTAPSTLTLFWSGDGTGFTDCNLSGSLITITDSYGNSYSTRVPVVANIGGSFPMDLSSTPLNLATNLNVHVECCVRKIDGTATCERCFDDVLINTTICPTLTLSADTASVVYSFNNTVVGTVTYDIILKEQISGTTIDTHTVVTSSIGLIQNTFAAGILPGTAYTVTIEITIDGVVTNTCPVGVITTESLLCDPPTNIYTTTIL